MQSELRICPPLPDASWKGITAITIVGLYAVRFPEFGPVDEAIFERETCQLWGKLIEAMRPTLAPNVAVTTDIKKTTITELASMLNFDPDTYTWATAIGFEYDPDDIPTSSLVQAWSPRFYAALQFAMRAEGYHVDDIVDGDPKNLLVLRRSPLALSQIRDEWVAALMDDERPVDYLEALKHLPALLEQRQALLDGDADLKRNVDDAIFVSSQPLLRVLIAKIILWFGCEDGTVRSIDRLDYEAGMLILELGPDSLKLSDPDPDSKLRHSDLSTVVDSSPSIDYLKALKDLPSLLEERQALAGEHGRQKITDTMHLNQVVTSAAIFSCVQPLLSVLMKDFTLCFGYEDGSLRSLHRLRYTHATIIPIILEFGPASLELASH
jgi:hypothetical protein